MSTFAPDLARLIKTSREVNDSKIALTVKRAVELIEEHPYAKIACYGLAFKANVDDLRESPALEIAHQLATLYGQRVKIVEPYINALPAIVREQGAELIDIDEAIRTCEVAIVLVDHDEFKMISRSGTASPRRDRHPRNLARYAARELEAWGYS